MDREPVIPVDENSTTPMPSVLAPPTRPLRELLPQLDLQTVLLRNRAYSTPACALGDGHVLVWQRSSHVLPAGALYCSVGEEPLVIAADGLSALEPSLQGFEAFVPSDACTALVEHALAPVLELIERLLGRALKCEAFKRHESAGAPFAASHGKASIRLGFVIDEGSGMGQNRPQSPCLNRPHVRGWVQASPALWSSVDFGRVPAVLPPAMQSRRLQAVPLTLSVQLGQCRLPGAELAQLQVGDALRISPREPRQASTGFIRAVQVRLVTCAGKLICTAQLNDDQLTLGVPMASNSAPMTGPIHASSINGSPTNGEAWLSGLECDLTFEVGSLRMTVAEVSQLKAGHSLRLGVRLQEQPVRILASGRQIARGELAAVGDELVVVLTDTHGLDTPSMKS